MNLKQTAVRMLLGIARHAGLEVDACEHAETEIALRESEEAYKTAFDNSGDAINILDEDWKILDVNKRLLQLSGYSKKELIEAKAVILFPSVGRAASQQRRKRLIEGKLQLFETILVTKTGQRIPVEVQPASLKNWRGRGRVIQANIRDITDRKRSEEVMLTIQKLESLGVLAGGIAHDFNNILTAILGNLSLAKEDATASPGLRALIVESQEACVCAKGLTHQLLTFARGGKPVIHVLSLAQILEEVCIFAARGSTSKCVFSIDEKLLPVMADKDQLSQVLQNLILNASQAMPEGGIIRVSASMATLDEREITSLPSGRYVRVSVKDEGVGIAESRLLKIFDPYFSTKAKGRGLGLAMCHSIIAKHGGYLGVDSLMGVGTTFWFLLPAATSLDLSPKTEIASIKMGSGRILVMDDDPMIAKVLSRLLKRLGYESEIVVDGKEALEACQKAAAAGNPFDVVIMDLTIPGGMGGKETVRKLKALIPDAKVVVSSGYSIDPVMQEHVNHGFSGVLPKPYRVVDVSKALSAILNPHPHSTGKDG